MFGMALKIFQMDLNPFNSITKSQNSQNQNNQNEKNKQDNALKQISLSKKNRKSQEFINKKQENNQYYQININKVEDKQNHRTKQQLKQSQKKIIEDFKKSITSSRSKIQQNQQNYQNKQNQLYNSTNNYNNNNPYQSQSSSSSQYQKISIPKHSYYHNNLLQKIDELSEQYLQLSLRQTNFNNNNNNMNQSNNNNFSNNNNNKNIKRSKFLSLSSYHNQNDNNNDKINEQQYHNKQKIKSCQIIKNIVKSVLIDSKNNNNINQIAKSIKDIKLQSSDNNNNKIQQQLQCKQNNSNSNSQSNSQNNRNLSSIIYSQADTISVQSKQVNSRQLQEQLQSYSNPKQHQNNQIQSSLFSLPNFSSPQKLIKDLFYSLGLVKENTQDNNNNNCNDNNNNINCNNKKSIGIQEIIIEAKNNYDNIDAKNDQQKLNIIIEEVKNKNSMIKINSQIKDNNTKEQQNVITNENHNNNKDNNKDNKSVLQKQKKVKLISPQTISQLDYKRQQLQKQLSLAIQFLTSPHKLTKFSLTTKQIYQISLRFSIDFKFIQYKYQQLKCSHLINKIFKPKVQNNRKYIAVTNNLVSVTKGAKTKNMVLYQQEENNIKKNNNTRQNKLQINQNKCFSLIFKDRSLDFQCQTQYIRDQYVQMVKILIKNTNKFQ